MLIQSRIEGVALAVAWPYLSVVAKASFKEQARQIATALSKIQRPPQYVFPDPEPIVNKRIQTEEFDILFSGDDKPLGFSHNDLQPSNIIVKDGKIVGIVDWEMSGFFGDRAVEVHRQMRCPGKSAYERAHLSEERLNDVTFWHSLFDE
jgi:Phosphotransferase enzyme family